MIGPPSTVAVSTCIEVAKLPATIVLRRVRLLPTCLIPPPAPFASPSLSAWFPVMVTLVSVTVDVPLSSKMPPPLFFAKLPLMVLFVIDIGAVATVPALYTPPPLRPAVLPLMVLPVIVRVATPALPTL